MKRWWGLLLGLLALPGHAESLRMLLVPVPGIMEPGSNGKTQGGGAIELMREISRRAGIPFAYEFYPQARAMLLVRQQADSCMPIAQMPDLRPMFKWSVAILPIQIVLMAKNGDDRQWPSLERAKRLRIGALRGSMVADRLRQLGFQPEESADYLTGLRKLQLGRLDLWAMTDVGVASVSSRLDMPPPKVAIVVEKSDIAFACNHEVGDEALASINRAIVSIQEDGSIHKYRLR